MKKIKLMLLSLSVLAVVGGALAFTAKTGTVFCTALPVSGSCLNVACPTTNQLTNPVKADDWVCTTNKVIGGVDNCHDAQNVVTICDPTSIHKTLEH